MKSFDIPWVGSGNDDVIVSHVHCITDKDAVFIFRPKSDRLNTKQLYCHFDIDNFFGPFITKDANLNLKSTVPFFYPI